MPLEVLPIPCLKDNYAYLVVQGDECLVIDPGDSAPVQAVLDDRELELIAIFCTHHHADHVAGVGDLIENWDAPVYAHRIDHGRILGVSHPLEDGDAVELLGDRFRVLHNPGHTRGAISYFTDAMAFTGDTLFCGGVGRLLEGTFQELFASTRRMMEALSPDSILYTGHEYAENNLRFASDLAPDDLAIRERYATIRAARGRGECCAKTQLIDELATNLFLRVHEPELRERLGMPPDATPELVFRELRIRKDRFG